MADFQRLDVYRCALDFLAWLSPRLASFGRLHADLADQLRRAGTSVPLNIAEATGRQGKDRAHHNAIAYGSAKECLAAIDVAVVVGLLREEDAREGREMLDRMIAMLAVMSGGTARAR